VAHDLLCANPISRGARRRIPEISPGQVELAEGQEVEMGHDVSGDTCSSYKRESGIVNTYEFNRAHFPGAFSF
jgi:hypothetical protein